MWQNILRFLGGDPHQREVQSLSGIVQAVNRLEESYETLSDEALSARTAEFRQRLADGATLDELLVEAFAAVREASKRTLGLRHYDVQLIGGITLHQGKISEMRTGEGKTLVATLPLYLNALTGKGVHLVTVNDYLARRDARWMAPIYQMLGLSVGVLQMAARTENGKNAFLVDLSKSSPYEDQNQLLMVPRQKAYEADIVYGTNSEFGFDYLRDNLSNRLEDRVQRGHYYAIVDEVDNILIDEARTPLIISGPAQEDSENYNMMSRIVRQLRPEDVEIDEKDRAVNLTEIGEIHAEELLGTTLRDPDRPEDMTPEQERLWGYLQQALKAYYLFKRNKDYLVQAGKVVIVDEFTGRLMPGRRWSEGLHQAIEAKENVRVEAENVTYATITIQNYFRMYQKLAGMTGTALTEAEEFHKIYKLEVLPIPMNLEYIASQAGSGLKEIQSKDDSGYRFSYYARRDDLQEKPIFWRRKDYPDVVYRTGEAKLRAITREILRVHIIGRPMLVGTTSVENSEHLSNRLKAEPIRRLAQILLVQHAYRVKHDIMEAETAIEVLQPLNRPLEDISPAELRQMVRAQELDLNINPEEPANLATLCELLELEESHKDHLLEVIQSGAPHQVLNARKHDEESQIIARAGGLGKITIATNMAGRGVDIKLGGELLDAITSEVNHFLSHTEANPYNMTNEERVAVLKAIPADQYGVYEESVRGFLKYFQDMELVRELGGLHVIGSERHEARRIDNQLRGRAARQGDPGSSRFFLSLEDDLMRLFGGAQVENLFKRFKIDENLPIEHNMVSRVVEQSQTRIEGTNFDVRKHLLEYDDVLNSQRKRIYEQRDRVFIKEDLTEDVLEMLNGELQERIPLAVKAEEERWRFVDYLNRIQPSIDDGKEVYPSFEYRLLIDDLYKKVGKEGDFRERMREALLKVAEGALLLEKDHLLRSLQGIFEKLEEGLITQKEEAQHSLEEIFDKLENNEDEETAPRPQEYQELLSSQMHMPLSLSREQLRLLSQPQKGTSAQILKDLRQQVDVYLSTLAINRALAGIRRRLPEIPELRPHQFADLSWQEIVAQLLGTVEDALNQRIDGLVGKGDQIGRDLDQILTKIPSADAVDDRAWLILLHRMTLREQVIFDRRSHQQRVQRSERLQYAFLAGQLLQKSNPQEITDAVLDHLAKGLQYMRRIYGQSEWSILAPAGVTLEAINNLYKGWIHASLGDATYAEFAETPLRDLAPQDQETIIDLMGSRLQTEMYRQILLSVISDLWVDYLTRVESLRIGIGLEAFSQRDPLVQYKTKASEMFSTLLADIRLGVVSRSFISRPRHSSLAEATARSQQAEKVEQPAEAGTPPPAAPSAAKQGNEAPKPAREEPRKKHRRR